MMSGLNPSIRSLWDAFTRAITQRWEGLVLKERDDPYYSSSKNNGFIKLKKDYIKGLGDTIDFAIVCCLDVKPIFYILNKVLALTNHLIDTVSFDELQELARQSMEVPEESESENKNRLKKLKRADPKPNYLVNSMNRTTSYNVGPEKSKRVNPPELLDERMDEKPENGKPLKRKLLSENSQQAVKRVKVSPITSTDDEATQPPPAAPTSTASSPFHEDSSVTLSANSSVTKPGSQTLARNSDQQLGCRVASSTLQEVTGEPEDQMYRMGIRHTIAGRIHMSYRTHNARLLFLAALPPWRATIHIRMPQTGAVNVIQAVVPGGVGLRERFGDGRGERDEAN
ncbi:hypothetical protein K469DRAFT_685400 [Zopfia rhizophila CBS 207.26]|uniref:ATP-dependent DNA ligase family profile domain-containing protein n=1 Tax=Zopfia rhizophila CBS 207.26 TaxID=1314779 RepID=A0A6A6D5U3_9PEZI|nr:hypothetical protein K469DRAFT_685400 [Zopfia rhizophila CBS 207.26]